MNYAQLLQELERLEAARAEIRKSGECLTGLRLERSQPGGTASSKAAYARLRSGKGNTLENGLKSQYVRLDQVSAVEAAIARGRELAKIERQIAAVRRKVEAIATKAAAMGLSIPEKTIN